IPKVKLRTVTKETSTHSLVQTHQSQVLHNPERRAARSTLDRLRDFTLDLQTDLDDFKRVGEDLTNSVLALRCSLKSSLETHHLTHSCRTTCEDFCRPPDPASILVGELPPNQIIYSELNSLLWCHTDQLRDDTGVQAGESF